MPNVLNSFSRQPELPLVSIVTPSLNAASFIEQTIESVLAQDYPNIEYTIMDGGSTDGTLEILDRHRGHLKYFVQKDGGTAEAVNGGFLRSRGAIFSWISADDVYQPGAVGRVVERFAAEPDAGVVYGEGYWINESGAVLSRYPTKVPYDPAMFASECCICQPTCFIRREAFEQVGMLDTRLRSAFDYELWMKLSRICRFSAVPDYLASSRMHRSNISLGMRQVMFEENMRLLRRYFGYVPVKWVYCYLSFLCDHRDQYFEPVQSSKLIWLASLPVGSLYNVSRLGRYLKEWSSLTAGWFENRYHGR